ncbi:MAG TPA: CCA tRNA nucleotidyltransferase [Longimicrobiales bacterium]|nr:CCA tRNA nucleotidyltransferase [Longimicrobiales bacterium]
MSPERDGPASRRGVRRHPDAPGAVRWIVRTLEGAGYETWAVGGAVRDVLLGVESVDWDLATRARPPEVRRIFRRTVPIGIEHGTVGVLTREGRLVEVTTFRRDVETHGRHAVVEFAETLDEDLGRRDFTVNAVAWHPLRDELHDPFDGVGDLERGVLRTVGEPSERFAEDYLRVLRALRFAGRFDLVVEAATWSALVDAVEHLGILSPERVRDELMKVLEKDPTPSGALTLWAASGALDRVAPELAALVGTGASGGAAGEGPDAWSLACLSTDAVPVARALTRLTALLADVGTPRRLDAEALPHEEGARERGRRRAAALLTRLRFSNAQVDRVAGNVGAGPEPPVGVEGAGLRRWLARVGPDRLPELTRVWGARARVREAAGLQAGAGARVACTVRCLRKELASGAPLAVGELALDGRDLIRMGLRPGPVFGEILNALLERVLDDPGLNRREVLAEMVARQWPAELADR